MAWLLGSVRLRLSMCSISLVPSAYGGISRASNASQVVPEHVEQRNLIFKLPRAVQARCMLQPVWHNVHKFKSNLMPIPSLNPNLSAQARPRSTLFTGSQRVAEQLTADLHGKARPYTKA